MRTPSITKISAIISLVPSAEVVVDDETVTWIIPSTAPVTDAQIEAEYQRLLAQEPIKKQIAELKQKLTASDYVALADYDKEKPELIAQRATWRAEIRELESTL
jgi:hypothetical protein